MVARARWLVSAPCESRRIGMPGLGAEHRDDMVVEIAVADELPAVSEQVLAALPGLAIGDVGLRSTDEFPCLDELAARNKINARVGNDARDLGLWGGSG